MSEQRQRIGHSTTPRDRRFVGRLYFMTQAAFALLAACNAGATSNAADALAESKVSAITGAACDPKLTYAKDIEPLVAMYCTSCHGVRTLGNGRSGAPVGLNFDTEQELIDNVAIIEQHAGAGPSASVPDMPPPIEGYADPLPEERLELSRWLACQ